MIFNIIYSNILLVITIPFGIFGIISIYSLFSKEFMTTYDETGSIGKRYRRQDVIGTPWCVTIDDETINNNTVTIRNRDTMQQITLTIDDAIKFVNDSIKF